MEYLILILIGLLMGMSGGLLGIGGSSVMIPAMVLAFGPDQHLYQASAMLCNFFVAISAVFVHRKQGSLVKPMLVWLIPMAAIGIVIGVWISNTSFFAGDRAYMLSRLFGLFLIYVAVYNCFKLIPKNGVKNLEYTEQDNSRVKTGVIGIATGLGAGLLGIGAGTISTPFQQLILKVPLRKAMSNSSAIIMSVALIGGIYKTVTLPEHGNSIADALRISAVIVPTAIIGGFVGGQLMHKLPVKVVRIIFICLVLLASYKMITTGPR